MKLLDNLQKLLGFESDAQTARFWECSKTSITDMRKVEGKRYIEFLYKFVKSRKHLGISRGEFYKDIEEEVERAHKKLKK